MARLRHGFRGFFEAFQDALSRLARRRTEAILPFSMDRNER
jgi:hypothetical protein